MDDVPAELLARPFVLVEARGVLLVEVEACGAELLIAREEDGPVRAFLTATGCAGSSYMLSTSSAQLVGWVV